MTRAAIGDDTVVADARPTSPSIPEQSMNTTMSRNTYVLTTLIAAVTAAGAAAISLSLALPVWAMFIGWIAFYTRGLTLRAAIENLACVGAGLVLGLMATLGLQALSGATTPAVALPIIVFCVAILVVSLRGLPVMSNLLGYFLGLVAWFAAHLEPSLESVGKLFGAGTVGTTAGLVSHTLASRLLRTPARAAH